MGLELNVVAKGETEKGIALDVGMKVEYRGHIPGGNVKITLPNGETDVAHPLCFEELR
jgi:hypothetical protein